MKLWKHCSPTVSEKLREQPVAESHGKSPQTMEPPHPSLWTTSSGSQVDGVHAHVPLTRHTAFGPNTAQSVLSRQPALGVVVAASVVVVVVASVVVSATSVVVSSVIVVVSVGF